MALPKLFDALPLPPILRTIGDLMWARRFLVFWCAFVMIGFALYQLPQQPRAFLCKFYEDNYKDTVTIKQYDTQENANIDLAAGRLDVVLADSTALERVAPIS